MRSVAFPQENVVLVSHVSAGESPPASDLEFFLSQRFGNLIFIGHRFLNSRLPASFVKIYRDGRLMSTISSKNSIGVQAVLYIKDVLYTIYIIRKLKMRFKIYFGIDYLCVVAGLMLRNLGVVEEVVFYPVDYVTNRFKNRFLNGAYLWMDKMCVRYSDYVWHTSDKMIDERRRRGILKGARSTQIVVPVGANVHKMDELRSIPSNRSRLVYAGGLSSHFGIRLALEAVSRVREKIPNVELVVTGSGPDEKILPELIRGLGIERNVKFLGFIEHHSELESIVRTCSIGLAPYIDESNQSRVLTEVAKPKLYMACGLPVIITKIPLLAKNIEETGSGLVINPDVRDLETAILSLIRDDELYQKCRINAIEFSRDYDWQELFSKAMSSMNKDSVRITQ